MLVLILFAVATYFVIRALQNRGALPTKPAGPRRPIRPAPPRVIGPDDDEDFLRDLERKRRRRDAEDNPDG